MKRLDRYVGKISLGAFGASLLFFLFLSILVDLLNSLPKYIDRASREGYSGFELASYLGLYYLKLMPVMFTMVTPFACVIAGMFSVARLQNANEVVPMLFVGRSMQRVLAPILWSGALGAVLMAGCWQWVVPQVGAALATDSMLLTKGQTEIKDLVHEVHGEKSRYLQVLEYVPAERRMKGITMLVLGDLASDVEYFKADAAKWDEEAGDWALEHGIHGVKVSQDVIDESAAAWLGRPDVTPEVLMQQSRDSVDPETMSYDELAELIVLRPHRKDVRLAYHRHITYPLANLLLLLLALPMAVRFERGSRVDRILIAIALCGGFMLFDMICQSLGQRGQLHPIVAAWSPTIVFGSLGVVLFGSIRT
ncbi:MAG: LptF/LptG family permease [Planctomycetota bacterium]